MASIERVLGSIGKDAALPARMALGATMLYHGTQKLRGEGRAQTAQMMQGLGFKRASLWGLATGIVETFAGVASILGIATRPAALAVLVTQGVAVAKVHGPKGFANMKGGFEFNLALMAMALEQLVAGPGRIAAHTIVERRLQPRGVRRMVRRVRPSPLAQALLLAV